MSATKILWGQVIVVRAVVLVTIWGATEGTAWQLGFQPELGPPWFLVLGLPFYLPPAFYWWWFGYDAYAPHIFVEGAYVAASGGFIAIAVAIAMSVWRAREAKNVETYGSARWSTRQEVVKAGLLRSEGVLLGELGREYPILLVQFVFDLDRCRLLELPNPAGQGRPNFKIIGRSSVRLAFELD